MSNYKDSFGQPKPPEQAIAARLTAITERVTHREQIGNYDITLSLADARLLSAHVETLTQQVAELEGYIKERTAPRLGGEPQYDCSDVDAFYLSQENRRLQQENARLTAEVAKWKDATASARPLVEQAEQQRDAAHAALKQFGAHEPRCAAIFPYAGGPCECGLDAALAASAPQKAEHDKACAVMQPRHRADPVPDCTCGPAPAQETERGR